MISFFTYLHNPIMRSYKIHCGKIMMSPCSFCSFLFFFLLIIAFLLSKSNSSMSRSVIKLLCLCHSTWIKTILISRSPNWLNSVSGRVKTNSSYLGLRMLFLISLCELITRIIQGLWGSRSMLQCGTQETTSPPNSLACKQRAVLRTKREI